MINSLRRHQRGFTLVELMVVVAIIGILAAIAVPNLTRFVRQAETAEPTTRMADLVRNLQGFVDQNPNLTPAILNGATFFGQVLEASGDTGTDGVAAGCQPPTGTAAAANNGDACINSVVPTATVSDNSEWIYLVSASVNTTTRVVTACVGAFPVDGTAGNDDIGILYSSTTGTATPGWENNYYRVGYINQTAVALGAAYGSCAANAVPSAPAAA